MTRAGQFKKNIFVSEGGGNIGHNEPLRLGPRTFASKLMVRSLVKIFKILWISLDLFSAEPSQYCP